MKGNTPFGPGDADKVKASSLEEEKRNGRLLNQAIIKYRIEKKDIVDSAYRSKLGQFSAAGASQISQAENIDGETKLRGSIYEGMEEEEEEMDDGLNKTNPRGDFAMTSDQV